MNKPHFFKIVGIFILTAILFPNGIVAKELPKDEKKEAPKQKAGKNSKRETHGYPSG